MALSYKELDDYESAPRRIKYFDGILWDSVRTRSSFGHLDAYDLKSIPGIAHWFIDHNESLNYTLARSAVENEDMPLLIKCLYKIKVYRHQSIEISHAAAVIGNKEFMRLL